MQKNVLAGGPRAEACWGPCCGARSERSACKAGAGGLEPANHVTSGGASSAPARLGQRKDEVWSWRQGPQKTSRFLATFPPYGSLAGGCHREPRARGRVSPKGEVLAFFRPVEWGWAGPGVQWVHPVPWNLDSLIDNARGRGKRFPSQACSGKAASPALSGRV